MWQHPGACGVVAIAGAAGIAHAGVGLWTQRSPCLLACSATCTVSSRLAWVVISCRVWHMAQVAVHLVLLVGHLWGA
jgi:hypothetical protein